MSGAHFLQVQKNVRHLVNFTSTKRSCRAPVFWWQGLDLETGGFQVRNPIPPKNLCVSESGYVKSVGSKCPPVGVGKKYSHCPGLPKKDVRQAEDQRGESHPTSMWRTGFIRYNKIIKALPEQGQYF
ncbi:hypothetical protein AVEN_245036-1 [Araneus ventricosus]|uniref:Uncharacterized protein n=1 Tax=Araneus ventricosus TaxID=182803 RepID=A0A4Y2E6J8_ARAVE|nr:hypothetical protein AVEN_245036-1 [Araneus ventricosus]